MQPVPQPVAIEEALGADIIILATPSMARGAVAAASDKWKRKIIIDAMNTYGVPESDLRALPSSVVVSESFPGAHVVKTFNQLPAKLLAQNPGQGNGRRVEVRGRGRGGGRGSGARPRRKAGLCAHRARHPDRRWFVDWDGRATDPGDPDCSRVMNQRWSTISCLMWREGTKMLKRLRWMP